MTAALAPIVPSKANQNVANNCDIEGFGTHAFNVLQDKRRLAAANLRGRSCLKK